MRNYAKASPTFWTGETAQAIKQSGKIKRDVQTLAFYLFTCPSSNWIGLFYLPIPTICHEIDIEKGPLMKAFKRLEEIDYAYYDLARQLVWVPGSAKFQIAEELKPEDNRIKGIAKDLQAFKYHQFAADFYRRYSRIYNLPEMEFPEAPSKALRRPFEAPPKPEAEAETEAEAITEAETEAGTGTEAEAESHTDGKPHREQKPLFTEPKKLTPAQTGIWPKATHHVPQDFELNGEDIEWARKRKPEVPLEALMDETEKFKDCHFKDAHDHWKATWRNWIRRTWPGKDDGKNGGKDDGPEATRNPFSGPKYTPTQNR
jgi:hypothetical protein